MCTYKTNSKFKNGSPVTDKVCDYLDWAYVGAVKTLVRGNTVFVRGTTLKPYEIVLLQHVDGAVIDQKTCKLMNFRKD